MSTDIEESLDRWRDNLRRASSEIQHLNEEFRPKEGFQYVRVLIDVVLREMDEVLSERPPAA